MAGIKTALAEFKALPGWNPKQAVFCMEHTGIYNAHLLEWLDQHKLAICGAARAAGILPTDQESRWPSTG